MPRLCHPAGHAPGRQHGAATLIVTMLLFFAMVLTALFVNRNLVFEQRTSSNQYRSTQAFEAAEAGLEWAVAQLNGSQRVGADCQPSAGAGATPFRERYLHFQRSTGVFSGATWLNGAIATPLQPACLRTASGWACSCPTQGLPALAPATGSAALPAFNVQFVAGPKPGLVRVVATGCTRWAAPCAAGATANADATAHVEVTLGLVPGLRTPPVATLTLRGNLVATAALGLHNADAATGVAVDAGGTIGATLARVTPPAGTTPAAALVDHDVALANLAPERLFAAYFGLAKSDWRRQPAVQQITCATGCAAQVRAAAGGDVPHPLLWVEGDLQLDGPLVLGSPQRPVIVVVNGALRLAGPVQVFGLLYASALNWQSNGAAGAFVRGALVGEGDFSADGTPELAYDAAVLASLHANSGSFARVSGSWHDF